jgi:hypothetical protein
MFYEQRFSYNRPRPAGPEQAANRHEKVDEKYAEITYHRTNLAKTSPMTRLGNLSDSCEELQFAPHTLPAVKALEESE